MKVKQQQYLIILIIGLRPYDDADYYWAYSYDKENWIVVYKGKQKQQFVGTFEQVVDLIEKQNQNIKSKMVHC